MFALKTSMPSVCVYARIRMNEDNWLNDLLAKVKLLIIQVVSIIVDCIFLCLWVVAQYFVDRLIERLKLRGIDQWVLIVFQVIFALSIKKLLILIW